MGYVDFETMMEFKRKILERIGEKESLDRGVCCRLATVPQSDVFGSSLFENSRFYEQGASYSFAVGNTPVRKGRSHYFYRGNGDGFKASLNDYLRQRKRYVDLELAYDSEDSPKIRDLLVFLLGERLAASLETPGRCSISNTSYFPLLERPTRTIMLDIDESYSSFCSDLDEASESEITMANTLIPVCVTESISHRAYKGRIYVVKNRYDRGHSHSLNWFCESVFGYLHLIISINPVDDGDKTVVYISQLRDYK